MNLELARALISTLPEGRDGLFNPWTDKCDLHTEWNGPEQRLVRLAEHLACDATLICCGEAPGYQGARVTGVAFTSERLLIEGAIPRVSATRGRLTHRERPYSEPSATIVWKNLYRLGLAETTILWNALQLHPHRPGDPMSNRTPTPEELLAGHAAIQLLREAFPKARWVAVGNKARDVLLASGMPFEAIRHPANGGATLFADGLTRLATTG
ncbi:TPA: hypothetical protein L6A81_34700 [Pseudomonas aeruginosa]|nr:hypothetical protein [Pseudomonas aeruginosa]